MFRAFAAFLFVFAGLIGSAWAAESPPPPAGFASAVFAGGCFWCVEADFDKVPGVKATVSGYTGGLRDNPTYRDHEGHVEAVEVTYDPKTVSYRQLADYFLRHIDPLDDGGQFCDRGASYRPAIFARGATEYEEARAAVAAAEKALGATLKVQVLNRATFWIAEDYHQDYYLKNAARYRYYRSACGRDARVKEVWGATK
jgi:peptide-methionine (S)-S-oxide reductase